MWSCERQKGRAWCFEAWLARTTQRHSGIFLPNPKGGALVCILLGETTESHCKGRASGERREGREGRGPLCD